MFGSCLDVFMEEDYIRDFDEFMDSKDDTLLVPNINNEGGVARTLAIKTNLLIEKWNYEVHILTQNKGNSAPFMISITRLCLMI
jgi:hypothetical protein